MRSFVRSLAAPGALVALIASTSGPATAEITAIPVPEFAVAATYEGGGPTINEFAAADFDGDGDNDLADANANSYLPDHGLPVLLNDGTGRFAAPLFTPFPTEGESPFDLATGDFDDDGFPDVVALSLSNFGGLTWRIRVMFSDGDGTFTFGPSVLANDGDIAAGDVDGDGDPDVVFSDDDFVDPAMKVYLNAGNGRLQLADSYPLNGDFVALGDVDGDGSLDIVFDFGPIYVQLNDGAGGFGAPISSPLGEFCCYAFTLADWNGDGDLDVAGSNASGGDIFVGLGDGSGHFTPFGQYEDLAYQVISMASADFSGDGFPDMVASGDPDFSAVQQFVYLHGEGDGTFSRLSVWDAGGWAMLAAEVNGDDLIDVISTDTISTGYAFVALSEGNGDFKASRTFLSVDSGSEIESSDVDHDGLVDLVVAGETFVAVHLNEGNRTFAPPIVSPGMGTILSMALADLNLDGNVDVVAGGFSPDNVVVMLGTGNGSFGPPTGYNNGSGAAVLGVAAGDVNGDGRPDVVSNTFSSLSYMRGRAGGTLGIPRLSGVGQGNQPATVLGDVTGDGLVDAVSIQDTGSADVAETTVAVNRGSGDGRFSLAQTLVIDTNATTARLADLNPDGDLDLPMVGVRGSNFGRTGLFVFPNLGGSLGSAAYYQYASGGLAIGDYNLDGHSDVASSCFFDVQAVRCPGSAATILLNRGDGTFARRTVFLPGGYAISGTPVDVQNDGKPDVVLLFSGFPSFFTEYVNVTE